jgi:4-amino-4-deoxy-L-arabinose transferase-like glycosyltransferase
VRALGSRGARAPLAELTSARTVRSARLGSIWPPGLLLALLCAALYLPGIAAIPPVDRDEAHYAQATRQMVDGGDVLRPRFLTRDRFKKPIGIYWLQFATVQLSGQAGRRAIWAYRVPSIIGALVAVLLTYGVGRRLFTPGAALLGAALLATCLLLVVEAHLATTDAALLGCVVGAQGCLAAAYASGRRGRALPAGYAAGFWLAEGAGVLIKGPVAPLVSCLTVITLVAWDRIGGVRHRGQWLRGLRCAWGVPLMLVVILPWTLVVGITTEGAYFHDWLADIAPKMIAGQESHGLPPGFYLLVFGATFWPASLTSGLGLTRAVRRRGRCGERFCLAWLVPTWLFFELMPTKLPHYVLPLYPALALLGARGVLAGRASLSQRPVLRAALVLWGVLTVAMGIAVAAGAWLLGTGIMLPGVMALLAGAAIGVCCVHLCWIGRPFDASVAGILGSMAVYGLVAHWVLPGMDALWVSRAAAEAIRLHSVGSPLPPSSRNTATAWRSSPTIRKRLLRWPRAGWVWPCRRWARSRG